MPLHDLVIRGGRVIDPESGLDQVSDVGVTRGRISAVAAGPLHGRRTIDARGAIVCPGFIDLHSHGQAVPEQRLQALDGVTTALELEAGALPVSGAYRSAAEQGRPINYGFATSWAAARMSVLAGYANVERLPGVLSRIGEPAWQRPAGAAETARILALLETDLAGGALGIGVLLGYAPRVDPVEYLAVAELAARYGVPVYTHARELVEGDPDIPIDGAEEILRTAGETGARMHWCHVNSTSRANLDRVLTLLERTAAEGSPVTAEAYPYGAAMTGIGAGFLAPERLARWGLAPSSVIYAPTGERVADADRLAALRAEDPGGLAILEFLDEEDPIQRGHLRRALSVPGAAVASDAMPLLWRGETPDPYRWPLPPGAVTHPRSVGTFARTLRTMVRESGEWSPAEAVRRCALIPARVVEPAAPAMRRKGRLQVGCDADVLVFDPDAVTDQATYRDSTRPSTGIAHVLVNGVPLVRDGEIAPEELPGRPVRGG